MSLPLRMTMLASGAGVGFALLVGTEFSAADQASTAPQARYFDPVLSSALCTPDADNRRRLLGYYQKLAQATETRPFPPPAPGGEVADAGSDAPLYDDLGVLSFPITTKNPLAQRYFDQGLRLAYGFNHAEARRAFRTAQKHDPDCAMCAWGEALVLGPNINAPMEPDAVAPAIAAVRKAQQNSASAGAREQALIAAVAQRYSDDPKAERSALDAAYAAAMERLAAQYPEDDNILALYAEALMDLSPWDYWEARQAEGQDAGDRRQSRESAGPRPGPSGRHPLLHPHDGSVGRAGARTALCAAARRRHARRRPSRAHAVPHLLPRRRLQGGGGGQQGGGDHR